MQKAETTAVSERPRTSTLPFLHGVFQRDLNDLGEGMFVDDVLRKHEDVRLRRAQRWPELVKFRFQLRRPIFVRYCFQRHDTRRF